MIKLYGITGSGSLAIVTFVIIFLDCCNDGDREEYEEEAIYRILQIKEEKDRKADKRRTRRVIIKKEEPPKPTVTQHPRPQQVHKNPPPATHHHHHYPQPSHIHHIHAHTSSFYHHPHTHSSYHYPYGSHHHHHQHYRRHHSDVGVDTSDRLETILKSKGTIHKSMRDAQTEPKREDVEHGTQTSRVNFDDKANNISEIGVSKLTRSPLPTLNESTEQQDQDFTITQAVSET